MLWWDDDFEKQPSELWGTIQCLNGHLLNLRAWSGKAWEDTQLKRVMPARTSMSHSTDTSKNLSWEYSPVMH